NTWNQGGGGGFLTEFREQLGYRRLQDVQREEQERRNKAAKAAEQVRLNAESAAAEKQEAPDTKPKNGRGKGRPSTIDRDLLMLADEETGLYTQELLAEKYQLDSPSSVSKACNRARAHRSKAKKV